VAELSHKNEPASAVIHAVALAVSVFGFVMLMAGTKEHGTVWHLIGFIVFGVSLILLYGVSSVYHFPPRGTSRKRILRRMDHMMIYVFMASTCTPVCLTIDNRACGWGLLAVARGCALAGIIVKATGVRIKSWASVMMYVIFGLLVLSVTGPVLQWLPTDGVGWLYGGGSLYLVGVIFYLMEKYPPKRIKFDLHAIWHLFVVAGSFSHAWLMMMKYVLYV